MNYGKRLDKLEELLKVVREKRRREADPDRLIVHEYILAATLDVNYGLADTDDDADRIDQVAVFEDAIAQRDAGEIDFDEWNRTLANAGIRYSCSFEVGAGDLEPYVDSQRSMSPQTDSEPTTDAMA